MEKLLKNNQKLIIIFALNVSLSVSAMELLDINDVKKMREDQQHIRQNDGLEKDCMPSHTQMQREAYMPHDLKVSQRKAAILAKNIRNSIRNGTGLCSEENIPIVKCLINDTQAIRQQYLLGSGMSDIKESLEQFEEELKKATQPTFWEIKGIKKPNNSKLRGLCNALEKAPAYYFGAKVREAMSPRPQKGNVPVLTTTPTKSSSTIQNPLKDSILTGEKPNSAQKRVKIHATRKSQKKLENTTIPATNVTIRPEVHESSQSDTIPAPIIPSGNLPLEQKPIAPPCPEAEALLRSFQELSLLREKLREDFRRELSSFHECIQRSECILDTYRATLGPPSISINKLYSEMEQLYAPFKTVKPAPRLFALDAPEIVKYNELREWVDEDFKKIEALRVCRVKNFMDSSLLICLFVKSLLSKDENAFEFRRSVADDIKSIQERAFTWGLIDQDQNDGTLTPVVAQIKKAMSSLPDNDLRKDACQVTLQGLNRLIEMRDQEIKIADEEEVMCNNINKTLDTMYAKFVVFGDDTSSNEQKRETIEDIRHASSIFTQAYGANLSNKAVQARLDAAKQHYACLECDWDYAQKPWYLRAVSWLFGWGPEEIKQPKQPGFKSTTGGSLLSSIWD
jgi:hypothetical protein